MAHVALPPALPPAAALLIAPPLPPAPLIDLHVYNVGPGNQDIIETGFIDIVIHNIKYNTQGQYPNPESKLQAYLLCLAQVLCSQDKGRIICESKLKDTIYQFAKDFPETTQGIIQDNRFKFSTHLSEVIRKTNYLSIGFGQYRNKFCNYSRRFFHHLFQAYIKNNNSSLNVTVTSLGLALVGGLETTSLFNDPTVPNETKKSLVAWAAFIGGITGVILPFTHVVYATTQEDP